MYKTSITQRVTGTNNTSITMHFGAKQRKIEPLFKANAYAIASNNEKQRQFHHILRGIGFNVKLKPFIQRRDGSAKGGLGCWHYPRRD